MQANTTDKCNKNIKETRPIFILFIIFLVVQNILLYYNFFDLDEQNTLSSIFIITPHILIISMIFSNDLRTRTISLVIFSGFCLASMLSASFLNYAIPDINVKYVFLSYIFTAILFNIFSHLTFKKRNEKLELITFHSMTNVDINRYSIIFTILFIINIITWAIIIYI